MKFIDWPGWFTLCLELVGVVLMGGFLLALRAWWNAKPTVPMEEVLEEIRKHR